MIHSDRPELGDSYYACMKRTRPGIALSDFWVVMQADMRARIGELEQPELLIQRKEDIDMPFEAAEYRHRSIANNELALIDATRHLPHISAAAEVIGETKAWLRNA